MLTANEIRTVIGATAYGPDGKIGRIGQIYLDNETGQPEWATVETGLFGRKQSFVPLAGATVRSGGDVQFEYDQETVKDAPSVDPDDDRLSEEDEARLYSHYGLSYSEMRSDSGLPRDAGGPRHAAGRDRDRDRDRRRAQTTGRDTSGPNTDDAMTRSEERLQVGTTTEEWGRARLRKYVVTENVTQSVPVTREEVRVEREPITDKNIDAALDGPDLSEEEHEVVLREERPVVEKETVPVERVRLSKDQVSGQETVSDEVRKERIETDGDVDRADRRR